MIKTIFFGLLLGGTLGFSLAAQIFERVGLQPQGFLLALCGLIFAGLLLHRGVAMLITIAALTMTVVQPEQILQAHGFDKDLLLAALIVIVFYPIVYRVMHS